MESEKKRQKLLIKEVYEVKPIKGFKKLDFLVGDQRWGTFSEALFPYIKAGTEIDADTEVKETQGKDGTTYINRLVTQIYVDGKPVKGRGGFLRGKSPEEIVSIETQVAVKEINAAWIAGKLTDKDAEVVEARKWWLSKVKRANQGAEHEKPTGKPAPAKPAEKEKSAEEKKDAQGVDPEWDKLGREEEQGAPGEGRYWDAKDYAPATLIALQRVCFDRWQMQPKDVLKELNAARWSDVNILPAEGYQKIAAARGK